jgi:hypothetical protein
MSACAGSYTRAVRIHVGLGSGECAYCGRRFDRAELAGESKQNVPLHSPRLSAAQAEIAEQMVNPDALFDREAA